MWCSSRILGPLLVLLHVSDIHRCSNKFRFYVFADDTNILYADKNLKDLETIVNIGLQNLHTWLTANKLTLTLRNPTKKIKQMSKLVKMMWGLFESL